ncbi:hypothetical protein P5673_006548 [Acropora cervicornis]|uniref:Uncharacterized protein n=1 Tax=Acropora cervicornis TaxID=6130 RepID=A0AAD9VBV0_ACRCE|nr:hypothetical protein P5673_006548 [Acropora cervicornis]
MMPFPMTERRVQRHLSVSKAVVPIYCICKTPNDVKPMCNVTIVITGSTLNQKRFGLHFNCDSIPVRNESRASSSMRLTLERKSLNLAFKKLDGANLSFLRKDSFFFIRSATPAKKVPFQLYQSLSISKVPVDIVLDKFTASNEERSPSKSPLA